jgi:cbb3-type cytochrome oxidase subunit 3
MLKFIRQYADKIEGIEIYPIISLLIFVTFFVAVLVYVRKMKQSSIDEMKQLPLDLQEEPHSKTP